MKELMITMGTGNALAMLRDLFNEKVVPVIYFDFTALKYITELNTHIHKSCRLQS